MFNKREYDRQWREDKPNYFKEWHKNNPESNAQWYETHREERKKEIEEWKKKNPEMQRIYSLRWHHKRTDLKYKINGRVSSSMSKSLKGKNNGRYWEGVVGYNKIDLKKHLIKTIPKEYVWNDYLGGKLQIDHIIPKRAFIFDSVKDKEFKQCWSLRNLRLLTKRDNMIKKDAIINPIIVSLLIKSSS